MILTLVFAVSGLLTALLVFEKARTMRRGKRSFVLRLISRGDARFSQLAHHGARVYADSKEEALFFVKKQLPLHSKNIYNKSSAVVKEKAAMLIGDIRGSKLLKKNDGLSEFFKALSEKESAADAADQADSQKEEKTLE